MCYQDVRKHTCKYTKKHYGHGVSTFACVVGAICKSPPFQIAPIPNLPILQFAPISNHPHFKLPHVTICPYFQLPPCGRANCNSPLHVCYQDVRKHTCKYTKKHHGHGMGSFACVVGAKSASWRSGVCDAIRPHCNSPILQITPIPNSPPFQIRPCYKSPPLQIAHVFNCPHSKSPLG